MVVNKVTGEKYNLSVLGSNWALESASTKMKRIVFISDSMKKLFTTKRGRLLKSKERDELAIIPDLVRSLQLEMNYLKRRGQKISIKF